MRMGCMNLKAVHSNTRGFSLVELLFSLLLGSLVSIALLLVITSSGYASVRSERTFHADMLLTAQVEDSFSREYDELANGTQKEDLEFNGFTFELTVETSDLDLPATPDMKRIMISLNWEEKSGRGSRKREVLRAKPI